MLSSQNIESELSYAYLHAVASRAGIICEYTGRHSDEAGVDAVLRVKGRLANDSVFTSFTVDVQLKATATLPVEQDGRYSHSLKLKNYNELRSTATISPHVLIVLFLPANADDWLTHSEERLIAQRCAYWASVRGAREITDQDSRTVYVPRVNLLSAENLRELMTRFSRGEVIDYVE
jgi:hypothetical protein